MFGLFGRKTSKEKLKDRLKMVLVADRAGLSPGKLEELKAELMAVIAKYFPGEEDNQLDVSLQQEGERMVLTANLPAKHP